MDRTECYWFHEDGFLDAITALKSVLSVHPLALHSENLNMEYFLDVECKLNVVKLYIVHVQVS